MDGTIGWCTVVVLFVESTEFCSPVCLDVSRKAKADNELK